MKRKAVDHLGDEYESISAMCRAYGIRAGLFANRVKRGWSLEDALTKPILPNKCIKQEGVKNGK